MTKWTEWEIGKCISKSLFWNLWTNKKDFQNIYAGKSTHLRLVKLSRKLKVEHTKFST